ncbi:MAG: four helix bundle protein [Brumimicrobium sp.]|nr:four helix bundle protein [Brumimicrobium sp.]
MNENILSQKSFNFSLAIIALYKQLNKEKEYVMSKQLLRSATSIGANIYEANYGCSAKDFVYKLTLSRKEANESLYWLQLLQLAKYMNDQQAKCLIKECEEIMRILTASIQTAKRNHGILD